MWRLFSSEYAWQKILNVPVLGSFWGTALWIVLILHVGSWFLSQSSAVQTMHKTCSFLTLHCWKSQSLCPRQSSPSPPIGQYYCWPCLHCIAFAEDSRTFAQADLKRKMHKLRLLYRGTHWHLWLGDQAPSVSSNTIRDQDTLNVKYISI